MCHVSREKLVKQGEPSEAHVNMWHLLSGWKFTIMDKGWDVIQVNQWKVDMWQVRGPNLDSSLLPNDLGRENGERKEERKRKEESF